jgi:hypothetical protein
MTSNRGYVARGSGSSAFAATHLGKNSVGTRQIKNRAVTGANIKKHTITSPLEVQVVNTPGAPPCVEGRALSGTVFGGKGEACC